LLESSNGHPYKPENRILRLMLRQKSVDQLHYAAGANREVVILEELHRRIQKVRRLDPNQIPVFLLEKLNS
jgi:hypothetical protein